MQWLLYPLALAAGALNAVQAGANAHLGKVLGQPVLAGLVVTTTSFSTMLLLNLLFGASPRLVLDKAGEVPWWAWIGGAMGASYVMASLTVTAQVGAGVFTALVVTAGVLCSVMLDHFGLVGLEVHAFNWGRGLACALMAAGVILLALY